MALTGRFSSDNILETSRIDLESIPVAASAKNLLLRAKKAPILINDNAVDIDQFVQQLIEHNWQYDLPENISKQKKSTIKKALSYTFRSKDDQLFMTQVPSSVIDVDAKDQWNISKIDIVLSFLTDFKRDLFFNRTRSITCTLGAVVSTLEKRAKAKNDDKKPPSIVGFLQGGSETAGEEGEPQTSSSPPIISDEICNLRTVEASICPGESDRQDVLVLKMRRKSFTNSSKLSTDNFHCTF